MIKTMALVEAPDHVCYRYRIKPFERRLADRGATMEVRPVPRNGLVRLLDFARLPRFDTILIQRKLLDVAQLSLIRRAAGRLIFDFDDAVFLRDSFSGRSLRSDKKAKRFKAVVQRADTVVAGNDYLADAALKAGAKPHQVVVVPTCVDTALYPQSASKDDETVGMKLVWIGSSSTLQGLEARRELFDRLAVEIPGIKLQVVCDRFPNLGRMPILPVTWSESTEAASLASADVGISWIPDDLWSRGKCGLKVLQYQAAGLPVAANPVGVHPEMIVDGRNGFLAESDDQWVQALKTLAADPARRREMGRNARRLAETQYSVDAWAETVVETWIGPRSEATATAPFQRVDRFSPAAPSMEMKRGRNGVTG